MGATRLGEGEVSATSIELIDGRHFDILNENSWLHDVETIAHALGNLCRFNGHCEFYSVAEHSVRVATQLREWNEGLIVQALGLHHDDVEAFMSDIPSPHKPLYSINGRPVREVEGAIELAHFLSLGLVTPEFDSHWLRVKEADSAVYELEHAERPAIGRGCPPSLATHIYLKRHRRLVQELATERISA